MTCFVKKSFRKDPSGYDYITNKIWSIDDVIKAESSPVVNNSDFNVPDFLMPVLLSPKDVWKGYTVLNTPGFGEDDPDIPISFSDKLAAANGGSYDYDSNFAMSEWKKWVKSLFDGCFSLKIKEFSLVLTTTINLCQ